VALAVVGTAVIQTALAGLGMALAGVPFAGLLTAASLILCIAQLGPGLILIPAVIWLYWSGEAGWGTFLLLWSTVTIVIDNVVRPMFVRVGADLPLLLIVAGVTGGLLSMGLVGLFVGPVVLAVTWRLFEAWAGDMPPSGMAMGEGPAASVRPDPDGRVRGKPAGAG
jgi:predicted PurR-regulated permease PerM